MNVYKILYRRLFPRRSVWLLTIFSLNDVILYHQNYLAFRAARTAAYAWLAQYAATYAAATHSSKFVNHRFGEWLTPGVFVMVRNGQATTICYGKILKVRL